MADLIGTQIAGYRVESLLSRGGMGEVYLAEQDAPKRKVALKLLSPELSKDAGFRERFVRESEAAASIDHPNVIPIYASGNSNGALFIAMRYVEGTDLRTLVAGQDPLPPERAVWICAQIADALEAAHERGLVHRDVKPANILVGRADHAYLSDFGLIRRQEVSTGITKTGQFMGTIDYVAPEQIRGDAVDGRADIYSLGCVLYECLTGKPPFRRDTEVATLYAHLEDPPPKPSAMIGTTPAALDEVISKAMAKQPQERYATAEALGAAIRQAGRSEIILTGTPWPERRRRWLIGAIAGVLLFALVIGLLLANQAEPPTKSIARRGSHRPSPKVAVVNSVISIDPSMRTISSAFDVGASPAAVDVEGTSVWTANAGEGTLSWIDTATGFQRTIRLPLDVKFKVPGSTACARCNFAVAFPAIGILASDGQGGVWVAGGGREVVHFDQRLRMDRTLRLPEKPWALVQLPDGSLWETTESFGTGEAIQVDPSTGRELARIEVSLEPINAGSGFGTCGSSAPRAKSSTASVRPRTTSSRRSPSPQRPGVLRSTRTRSGLPAPTAISTGSIGSRTASSIR